MANAKQKAFMCQELLKKEGKVSFEAYKNITGIEGATGTFFKRFFDQCFHKRQMEGIFVFDFDKYWASNIRKLDELPREWALKLKFHFFLKDNK